MFSNQSSTPPALHGDGTISASIIAINPLPTSGAIMRLWLPVAFDIGGGFGRYLLVRCVEDTPMARANEWSHYARRPLFCAALPKAMPDAAGSLWELWVPDNGDAAYQWLLDRVAGSTVNVIGPLGQTLALAEHTRALVVLSDMLHLFTLLPAIETMLDRGGRVALVIKGENEVASTLLPFIPLPVETSIVASDAWASALEKPVRWADQVCAAFSPREYASLAHQLRTLRFHLDADFAHVFYPGDLICGTGACLACVVPTREGGYTRSCVNGPVVPLTTIA